MPSSDLYNLSCIFLDYFSVFKRELERDIQADTSGDFKRLLTSLVTGNREDRPQPDVELAKKEANELYKVNGGVTLTRVYVLKKNKEEEEEQDLPEKKKRRRRRKKL